MSIQLGLIGGSAVNFLRTGPVTDFTSLDASSLRPDFIRYAQATFSDRWTDFNANQFAIVFLDIETYLGDLLTFHMNAGLREQTIATAQRRQSVVNLAKTLGYTLASASPTSTDNFQLITSASALPITLATSDQFAAGDVIFQPDQVYTLTTSNGVDNGDGTYTHTITVIEGEGFYNVSLGTSDGSREQVYALTQSPLIDGTLEAKVSGIAWTEVLSFSQSNPDDQHYRVETNDDFETHIFFGDGVNGKIPPSSAAITATWKIGGGVRGRVGVETITDIVTPITGVISVTNPANSDGNGVSGGADEETITQAKANIPLSFSSGDRAVTVPDYAVLAKRASTSVAKVIAVEQPSPRIVEMFIAPAGGGQPTQALLDTVSAYISPRNMIGRRAKLAGPTYAPVLCTIDVFVDRSVNRDQIKQIVQNLFFTPNPDDPQTGLLDFENVGFGGRSDSGEPQLTIQKVFDVLDQLQTFGVQTSRVSRFANAPLMRPYNRVVTGDGASDFEFTTIDYTSRKRRHYRLKFTSATTYRVFERIVGTSTSLSPTILRDDRLVNDYVLSGVVYINPNSRQRTVYRCDVAASATEGVGSFVRDTGISPYALNTAATVGDPYYIEFEIAAGTVGTPYVPDNDPTITWTVVAGAVDYVPSDEFIVRVTEGVGTILLADDEIPFMDPSNVELLPLTVNVATAI